MRNTFLPHAATQQARHRLMQPGVLSILIAAFLINAVLQAVLPARAAWAADKIGWSKPRSATYSPLYNGIVATNYELAFGGLNLASESLTKEEAEADFVMSSSTIGARSVMQLNEKLETATLPPSSGFKTRETLEVGGVYLVTLHDHTFAKLRIDRMSNSAITFSYAVEAPETSTPAPAAPSSLSAPATPSPSSPATPSPAPAAPSPDTASSETPPIIVLSLLHNVVLIDGLFTTLDDSLKPRLVDGRTMVPLRFIAEALGADLVWDNAEQKITLTLNGSTLVLWLDQSRAIVNGQSITLDVPPQRIGDSTFVPVRFISEKLQQKVDFDSETSTISINAPDTGITAESESTRADSTEAGEASSEPRPDTGVQSLIGSYSLFVKGGAYTTDNYAAETRTTTVFAGSPDGFLDINSDGTFAFTDSTFNWNSSTSEYDAGYGTWKESGDWSYPILLTDSKTNKSFKIGKTLSSTTGYGDIYVWEVGGSWINGSRK
ncbi:copper amine oxidase N-terminal domain-containing protein [Paenibacillus sp. GYB004]|uniref:copper amine oxidase N-terminal domain-containing protein n=1 Tax=Paenibacillus sp. GYB004 TaxID=2994393 RepID=UPI002F96402E